MHQGAWAGVLVARGAYGLLFGHARLSSFWRNRSRRRLTAEGLGDWLTAGTRIVRMAAKTRIVRVTQRSGHVNFAVLDREKTLVMTSVDTRCELLDCKERCIGANRA